MIKCVRCGTDITNAPVRYPYGKDGGYYCYDCDKKIRPHKSYDKKPRERMHKPKMSVIARRLLRKGMKVSEIAEVLGCEPKTVYEVLNK